MRLRPSSDQASGQAALRDGSPVEIRPIEPEDRDRLRTGFERLSTQSKYLRFQTVVPSLTEQQLTYLVTVDHHDHEALVAVEPTSGDIIGVARFVRMTDDVAECAIVVGDEWQGRGLGTALLNRLADRARDEGIERFTALVLAENEDAIRLLERLGGTAQRSLGTQVELDVTLPSRAGAGEPLTALLRAAARGLVVPAISTWGLVSDVASHRARAPAEHANAIVARPDPTGSHSKVLKVAAELASIRGAQLHLVDSYWPVRSAREEVGQRLSEAAELVRSPEVDVAVHVRGGDPVDAIVDVAQEQAAELIVIDPSSGSLPMPWRLHSMIARVCARAPCDVLVAR